MNADIFEDAFLLYDYEFTNILGFIRSCHEKMILKYAGQKIENNEGKIRNRLYKDFLNSDKFKSDYELFPCRFECESAEINDNYDEVGYTDIKILTSNSLVSTEAYYIIECKRLDGKKHLNNQYIENGIVRFVEGKYPSYFSLSGMIGFVVEPIDINQNVQKINVLLKKHSSIVTTTYLINAPSGQTTHYMSKHIKNEKDDLNIRHLMFDFSSIMS